MAPVTVESIDKLIVELDAAYKRVVEVHGSTVKLPSAEINLLSIIGSIRDAFHASLRSSSREMLDELFGGSCTRVAHIRALIDRLELSPMNASDQRLRGCLNACVSVKEVLVDMGLADVLEKAEEQEKEALEAAESGSFTAPETEGASVAEAPAASEAVEPAAPAPEPAAPAPAAEEPAAVVDDLAADMGVRPPLGALVEEEWAELMGVVTCKIGCGRRVAPGTTKSGKAFDTCCRGCATGKVHYKTCGHIDPAKVGEGLCNQGCGRPAAEGRDKYDMKFTTCCRGCANGGAHDEYCKPASAGSFAVDASGRKDERTFFTEVKGTLEPPKFGQFLESCRLLTRKKLTFPETVDRVGGIFGKENVLTSDFELLVGERMKALEK